jgi:pSer/pThr/pTyr-binding forkhead associated (FHA) protein
MQIDIELVGKANRWSYQQPRIRIGRGPSCDVSLPGNEYPMISREHLALEVTGSGVTLSDMHSANGTFLNGARVATAAVASGDTLRLGSDGPELRIYLRQEAWQAAPQPSADRTVASSPPTAGSASPAARPEAGATRLDYGGTALSAPPQQASEPSAAAVRVSFGEVPPAEPPAAPAVTGRPNAESETGVEIVIERKLNQIRNLLAINLVGILILLCALFYQGQQIAKNKDAVADLQRNAENAVKQFTPALDARLSAFEKRVDGMDAKMQQAQDRFMNQMQQQMPKILDAYFNRKMEELKRQGAALKP